MKYIKRKSEQIKEIDPIYLREGSVFKDSCCFKISV